MELDGILLLSGAGGEQRALQLSMPTSKKAQAHKTQTSKQNSTNNKQASKQVNKSTHATPNKQPNKARTHICKHPHIQTHTKSIPPLGLGLHVSDHGVGGLLYCWGFVAVGQNQWYHFGVGAPPI